MLTTEELGRLSELVGQAKAILNGSGTAAANPEAAHRQVTELLEEGIRLCRTPAEEDARGNGFLGEDGRPTMRQGPDLSPPEA